MATTRTKVEALYTTLCNHIITINGAPETTPEYMSTLKQLKSALYDHTDITREIIPLENSEENPNERMALSRAVDKSMQTDKMIVNFTTNYCDEYSHPGALVNNRMAAISVTASIVASTNILKTTVHEYKNRNDRLWIVGELGALGGNMGQGGKDLTALGQGADYTLSASDWIVLVSLQVDRTPRRRLS